MVAIVVTGFICATLIFLAWRAEKLFTKKIEVSAPKVVEPPTSTPEVKEGSSFPSDLMQLAMKESEGWARESAVKSMQELYEACGDWSVVRAVWRAYPEQQS